MQNPKVVIAGRKREARLGAKCPRQSINQKILW